MIRPMLKSDVRWVELAKRASIGSRTSKRSSTGYMTAATRCAGPLMLLGMRRPAVGGHAPSRPAPQPRACHRPAC